VRDIRRYWREVRVIEASLPECVWLVSAEDSPPVQVPAAQAALLLHAKSHRIAEDTEVSAHLGAEEAKDLGIRRGQLRRKGIAVVSAGIRPPLPR
jgi:hypothetical protein